MTTKRSIKTYAVAVVVALAATVASGLPANAAQLDRIRGEVPNVGELVMFSTPHYKGTYGTITADLTYVTTPTCGAPVQLGLRQAAGNYQFTNSAGWTVPGALTFTVAGTSSTYIGPVTFFVNARQLGTCSSVPVSARYFEGGLWF